MNISPQYKLKISILDQWITSQECIKFTITLVLVECFPLTQAKRAPHLSRHKQLGCSDSSRSFLSTITWLKGYFIVTTYEDARARQSWGGNLRTPCMRLKVSVASSLKPNFWIYLTCMTGVSTRYFSRKAAGDMSKERQSARCRRIDSTLCLNNE